MHKGDCRTGMIDSSVPYITKHDFVSVGRAVFGSNDVIASFLLHEPLYCIYSSSSLAAKSLGIGACDGGSVGARVGRMGGFGTGGTIDRRHECNALHCTRWRSS